MQFINAGRRTDVAHLLASMTQCIFSEFAYARRLEQGTKPPLETLRAKAGSCRDLALFMMEAARSLGLEENRIVLLEQVRDTEDESLAVRARVGDEPLALVTSGWHLPRAVALFRHAGLSPVPCPTGFTAHDDGKWHWSDLLWDVESLERSTYAVRERIGYLWIWLRGKT